MRQEKYRKNAPKEIKPFSVWLIELLGGVTRKREAELEKWIIDIHNDFREKCDECLELAYDKSDLEKENAQLKKDLEIASKNDNRGEDGKFIPASNRSTFNSSKKSSPKKKGEK